MTDQLVNAEESQPVAEAGREFLVRRDIAFLNHGSFGACPRPVFEEYQRWQRELEAEPVEFLGRRMDGLLAEARAPLAALIGAAPDDLVFVPNATHGVNIVARSLAQTLRPGDEVLGTDHEYGAVERTWTYLCEQRGATYRAQPVALPVMDAAALVDQLWRGVTERTRVIVVSHITSPTALIFPVAEICRRAREQGIVTIVDGAHAPGQLDLDLGALDADWYTGNCHKWLCAPKGSAFLFSRPEHHGWIEPVVTSWGWEEGSSFAAKHEWQGTFDPAAWLTVPTAIEIWHRLDLDGCRALALHGQRLLPPIEGVPAPQMWASEVTPGDPGELKAALLDRGIDVPVHEWQGRRLVRVSIAPYNTDTDLDRLRSALDDVLSRA
jgi:isopenicillin-N epimerase